MSYPIEITLIIKDRVQDKPEVIVFTIDSFNIHELKNLLNSQDVERLGRLMKDVHNLRQEILSLERENKYLKSNMGTITNAYMNMDLAVGVEFQIIETDDSLELSDVDLKELEHKSNGFSHG